MQASSNYCAVHCPLGCTWGEPGSQCSVCGGPLSPTAEEVAQLRTIRNQIARREVELPDFVIDLGLPGSGVVRIE